MEKQYISMLKINMVEEFRLRKIDETRDYLLDGIKYNGLMRQEPTNYYLIRRHVSLLDMLNTCLF